MTSKKKKLKISADVDPKRFPTKLKKALNEYTNFHSALISVLTDEVSIILQKLKDKEMILNFRIRLQDGDLGICRGLRG